MHWSAFLAYKKHFDEDADPGAKLAVFSTGPAIRSYAWNFITEVVGTFVLVFVILCVRARPPQSSGRSPSHSSSSVSAPASVVRPATPSTLLVTSARASRTPCCPSGARAPSDWSYSWVPVLGPLVGGALAGLAASVCIV